MSRKQKWTTGIAAVAGALVIALMVGRHSNDIQKQTTKVRADMATDQFDQSIVRALQDANVPVNGLLVRSVGGVVVVRGNGDKAAVQQVMNKLNVQRVANLVTGYSGDDEAIRRDAERQLASTRALDGAMLHISCAQGTVKVTGTVQNELQADVARSILRGVNGVRSVKIELATAIASATPRS